MTSLASNSGQRDLPAHNEAKTKDTIQSAGLATQALQSNFKPTWGYAEKPKQDGVLKAVGKEVLKGAMLTSPLGIGLYTSYKVANHAANAWAVKKKPTITVTDNVVKKPVSLATQGITDNVTDSVIDAKNSDKNGLTTVIVTDKVKKGFCEFCSAEFDKKVSWKRFCSESCRISAWELKSGKRVNLKKKTG